MEFKSNGIVYCYYLICNQLYILLKTDSCLYKYFVPLSVSNIVKI